MKPFYVPEKSRLAEGITYDVRGNAVLWVDIMAGLVHRVKLGSMAHDTAQYPHGTVGAFALCLHDENTVLVAGESAFGFLQFGTNHFKEVAAYDFLTSAEKQIFRANDSSISPAGNYWIGVMMKDNQEAKGKLMKYDFSTKQYVELVRDIAIPNGLAWNAVRTKFFHVDSLRFKIFVYDYDIASDSISNKKVFFDVLAYTNDESAEPDGMTIDSEDNLYLALWGFSSVIKISKEGQVVHKWEFPAKRTDCVVFGGPKLDDLFVSTADLHLDDVSKLGSVPGDYGGAIFRVPATGFKGTSRLVYKGPL